MIPLNAMRFFLTVFLLTLPLFFSQAQSLTKEEAGIYREKGYKLQSMGDLEGALVNYQKAAILDPDSAEAYNDIGVIYESQGRDDLALEMYKKALEIDSQYLPAYTNLAFLYERTGDLRGAAIYWKKRYEAGQEGEYWHEVSAQHLLKLGTYPQIRKEMLQEKAVELSRKIIHARKQERLKLIEKAQFHFTLGNKAFMERDYEIAAREFLTVLSLNPPDKSLLTQAEQLYQQSERLNLRAKAVANAKNALDYMNNNDYSSAGKKLEQAMKAVLGITRGK